MLSQVKGTLDVNSLGCFTVGGAVLIADFEASILEDGSGIEFPKEGAVEIGSTIRGVGGELDAALNDADTSKCLPEGDNGGFLALSTSF